MSLHFTTASFDAAPRVGVGIGAVLTLTAGLVSTLRVRPMAINAPGIGVPVLPTTPSM